MSLEDIVEEVVGEIYDEDDEEKYEFSEDSITMQEDGTFLIRGDAELSDVDTILTLELSEEDSLKEFATLSGFLCGCAGEIPTVGDFIMSRGWCFEIVNADDKRILQVKVERLTGSFDDETVPPESENPFKNLLNVKQGSKKDDEDGQAENRETGSDIAALEKAAESGLSSDMAENTKDAEAVERMVDSAERKRELLDRINNEANEADSSNGN